jgi:hypothetical protein
VGKLVHGNNVVFKILGAQMKKSLKNLLLTSALTLSTLGTAFAEAPVTRDQRVLVVLSELDSAGAPELEQLYRALEDLTGHFVGALLQDKYKRIITLRNNSATLANFKRVVYQEANKTDIRAIDVIISVHGLPTKLAMANGTVTKDAFRDEMLRTTTRQEQVNKIFVKKKLRALYNLACYAGRNMQTMRDIGFATANGARGVNANSEVELVPALTAWANGIGFKDSFTASNNPVALFASDAALREIGRAQNSMLKDIDSEKLFSGEFNKTINSPAIEQ